MKDLGNSTKSIFATLRRYHMVIFIVAILVGLMLAILLLNSVVAKTSGSISSSESATRASFDQATITRIKQLKTSSEPSTPLDFSKGRISPFSE